VFLGCPDTENSILPGHELLKNGRGTQAVFLSSLGSLIAIFLAIILSPILSYFIPKLNSLITPIIAYILILILIILILKEKNKLKSIWIISLTGILGLIVLNLNLKDPLLPLLTGLFGTPSLIESLKNKTKIPEQKIFLEKPKKIIRPTLSATISSSICGFLPGLGTSQAAILSSSFYKSSREEFIILIGATNTLVLIISFIALYSISKIRTGVAATIENILPSFSYKILLLILLTILISGIFSFFITLIITMTIANKIDKINYIKLCLGVLGIIFTINLIIGGIMGILILFLSTIIGLYSNSLEIKKSNMMSCLLIPTIKFYLFNN
jgi:putative membrane protein